MDANGSLWWRAGQSGIEQGWPWGHIDGYTPPDPRWPHSVPVPSGAVAEDDPTRPLTLVIRAGKLASPPDA